MLIAAACFVHCVAGPVVLSFAGLASLVDVSERLEPLFLLSSFGAGTATLIPAYRTKHKRLSCLVLFFAGLVCFVMRRRIGSTVVFVEPILVAVGALLIIGAHALNLKLSKRCQCCESPEHNIRREHPL
jgi:hypothetical protein